MSIRKSLILLLEDDPVQALLLRSLATDQRYDFHSTDNVQTALKIAAESALVACVVDLGVYQKFPEFNRHAGIDFIARARKDGVVDIPILVVTASHDPDILIPCFEAGCDDFVLKSEGVDKLVERLKRWLKLRPMTEDILLKRRNRKIKTLRGTIGR